MPITSLLDIYNNSTALRPTQAKQTGPNGLAVNFFDTTNTFAAGFTDGLQPNSDTQFTSLALNYFDTELKNMVIPVSFVRVDPAIPLQEYSETLKYFTPGASGFLGSD